MDRFKGAGVVLCTSNSTMFASGSSPGLFGYLAFVELATHGTVGGYLIVNEHARPVEFHCTAPVCPSRTHEILYGPTLRSVLCAEQIGPSLVAQSELNPALLLTDEPEALALRACIASPIVLVGNGSTEAASLAEEWSFPCGARRVTTASSAAADHRVIERIVGQLSEGWDLAEPLDRIRAAIHEAQQAAA